MKRLLFFAIYLFLHGNLFAQFDTCGTTIPEWVTYEDATAYGTPQDLLLYKRTEMTDPLRIYVHIGIRPVKYILFKKILPN